MTTKAPPALFAIYHLLDPYLKTLQIGGIVGDTAHVAGGGYHISREDLKNHGQGSDYSIQCPADGRGASNYAAAVDLTLSAAEMKLVTGRLRAACTPDKAGDYDARIEPLREIIGCLDGTHVCGYNRVATGSGTRSHVGWVASGFSDTSHRWHVHLSFLRDYCNDPNSVRGVAEVVAGLKTGAMGWADPSPAAAPTSPATGPAAPTPAPAPAPTPAAPTAPPTPPQEPSMPNAPALTLDAPGSGNWQGAVTNRATGEWFIAEAQKIAGHDREDTVFHRFDKAGKYLDSMRCQAAEGYGIHPTSFGVSSSNVLWFTWNEAANDVVTARYRPGATIKKAETQAMHVFSAGNVQVGFDPSRDYLALREITKARETYTRRRKQDVLDGVDEGLGKPVVINRSDDRVVQGFTVIGEYLYVLTGLHTPPYIEKWSFVSGKQISKTGVGRFGLAAGETGKCEPEGIDGGYFGCKVFTGSKRRLRIYKHGL